ncbi:hypothetical protein [Enterovirga sp. CN4-39]|uniref:hypothetical protein n=1 Tax=Enterovirga sp. CN4-39 TaxID=3400910 RepID=UPI003C0A7597
MRKTIVLLTLAAAAFLPVEPARAQFGMSTSPFIGAPPQGAAPAPAVEPTQKPVRQKKARAKKRPRR